MGITHAEGIQALLLEQLARMEDMNEGKAGLPRVRNCTY